MPDPRVLVVEDDPDRALLIRRALAEADVQPTVETTGTAEEAVEVLSDPQRRPPSLVLLDLRLPGRDGFAVLEAISARDSIPPVPVVVLTSSDETEDMRKSYDLGANGFVTKPVDFDEFRDAMNQIARFWLEINRPPPGLETV